MSLLLSPFKNTYRGAYGFIRGLRWLKSHPRYMFYLIVPFFLAIAFAGFGWNLFMEYEESIFKTILFAKPENIFGVALFYICKTFLYLGIVVLFMVASLLLSNVISFPIYDVISLAVEREMTGSSEEVSILESIKLIPEEMKRVAFILVVSLITLMIPVVNTMSIFVTAFLVGWDLYDYPFARRGWSFGERLGFVFKDAWTVMGFGLWLAIPLLQVFIMPLAVTGGTILGIEALQRQGKVQTMAAKV